MAKRKKPAEPPVVLTDPRSVRAIAHPARITVIDDLYQGNVRTSTELAELTGLTASAMSYHLRALEKWGIVRRVEGADDGRERPWAQAGPSLSWDASGGAGIAPTAVVTKQLLDEMAQRLDAWNRVEGQVPTVWRNRSELRRGFSWFTPEEASQFSEGIATLLTEIGAKHENDAAPTAKRVAFLIAVVPTLDGFNEGR